MQATFKQARDLLELVEDRIKEYDANWLQNLHESGLLSDVMSVEDPDKVSRDDLRKVLALPPLEAKPLWLNVDFGQTTENMFRKVKWKHACVLKDARPTNHHHRGKGKSVCVPVSDGDILKMIQTWEAKGFQTADVRETLATFRATENRGAFFCGVTIPPVNVSGLGYAFFSFIRSSDGEHLIRTGVYKTNFLLSRNTVPFVVGKTTIQIKKYEVYLVMIAPPD